MTALNALRRRVQQRLEESLGVTVSRTSDQKHFYPHMGAVRDWSSDDVVFDVGANDGRTIIMLERYLPSPRIYAFEPVAATYRELCERTRHMPNVRCRQLALGDQPGAATMYLHSEPAMNSLSAKRFEATGTESVTVSTIDDVMTEEGLDSVDFLKIDTEGHEREVLLGAEKALSERRIALLQAEVGFGQSGAGHSVLEEVATYLEPMGYLLYGIYNQSRRRAEPPQGWPAERVRGYRPKVLVYGDAVFIAAS